MEKKKMEKKQPNPEWKMNYLINKIYVAENFMKEKKT